MSPSRITRPPARIERSRIASSEPNAPEGRSAIRSVGVSNVPDAATAFCEASVEKICAGSMPSVASFAFDTSTKTFSSCSPMKSTFATDGTRRSSARTLSPRVLSSR